MANTEDYVPPKVTPLKQTSPVTEIARQITRLTYGELKEFVEAVDATDIDKVWDWATAQVEARR